MATAGDRKLRGIRTSIRTNTFLGRKSPGDGAVEILSADDLKSIAGLDDEGVRDLVASFVVAGTGVSVTHSDPGNTLTIASTITQYTDEMAQDTIATLIQNGTGITWSYSDVGNTLTPTVTITQYTDEMARDAIGTALTDSATIDFTPNDGADTITAIVKPASIDLTSHVTGVLPVANGGNGTANRVIAHLAADQTDVTGDGTAVDIIGGAEDVDAGATHDATTGVMTMAAAGDYYFWCALRVDQIGAAHTSLSLELVTTGGTHTLLFLNPAAIAVGGVFIQFAAIALPMALSDTAKFRLTVSNSTKTVDILSGTTNRTHYGYWRLTG